VEHLSQCGESISNREPEELKRDSLREKKKRKPNKWTTKGGEKGFLEKERGEGSQRWGYFRKGVSGKEKGWVGFEGQDGVWGSFKIGKGNRDFPKKETQLNGAVGLRNDTGKSVIGGGAWKETKRVGGGCGGGEHSAPKNKTETTYGIKCQVDEKKGRTDITGTRAASSVTGVDKRGTGVFQSQKREPLPQTRGT